jgi:hypothetical protein
MYKCLRQTNYHVFLVTCANTKKNSHEITAIRTRYVMALNQSGASLGGSDISLYLTSYFIIQKYSNSFAFLSSLWM